MIKPATLGRLWNNHVAGDAPKIEEPTTRR